MGKLKVMSDISKINFSHLDKPELLNYLFHPRVDNSPPVSSQNVFEISIPVEKDISVHGQLYSTGKKNPVIIFFHGNGEIVSDYADLGPIYNSIGLNFLPVDYRGYGKSSGIPTVTNMMQDCHTVFDFLLNWLKENDYKGPVVVMGRSLGSASALELAKNRSNKIDALIIESGFAQTLPLLKILGILSEPLGLTEENCFRNIDKISEFSKPTLIIHAQFDHIIPFQNGVDLYDKSPAENKNILEVKKADHNAIFYHGINDILMNIKEVRDSL